MTVDETQDPRRERLIAALYGELAPPEQAAFEAELERDDELRAEWEELSSTRSFLKAAVDEQPAPQFVFLAPPPETQAARAAERSPRRSLWSGFRGPVFGFALGTASLVLMLLLGLRVDSVDGGLWVHFGQAPDSSPASMAVGGNQLPGGIPLVPSPGQGGGEHALGGAPSTIVSGQTVAAGSYLTHDEFASYSNQLMELMATGLSDYETQRQRELRRLLRSVYEDFDERQQRNRQELGAEFERAWLRLLESSQQGVEPGAPPPNNGAADNPRSAYPSFPSGTPGNGN